MLKLLSSPLYSLLQHRGRVFPSVSGRAKFDSKVLTMAEYSASRTPKHTNRLAAEHSPYLLQHAHNPVDWYPWGDKAFEEARKRDVPIFLSIGYSTCHWCHVMEAESFEDEGVATLLNDWFVSVKVDREERPDVDKVYMTYVQALYGGGGWPLSVFLSPGLQPFLGGTYFPPIDNYGRPGFKTILRKVNGAWRTNRDDLIKSGSSVIEQLSEALSMRSINSQINDDSLSQSSSDLCAEQLGRSYDPKFGGFGRAPKFPRPVEMELMLYQGKKLEETGKTREAEDALKMVLSTLRNMARGGIHDHVGGGFHRYSVDECWHVPHFEKMLYDQGQIANLYANAFSISGDPFFASVARDTLDYLKRDMIGHSGEIFSAEDADSIESQGTSSRKKEGAFYIWSSKEIEDVLGENAALFKEHYYVKDSGNCDLSRMSDPHGEFEGMNVLIERGDASEMSARSGISVDDYGGILRTCRVKLLQARSRRMKPQLDDKVIVSWNGLAISALARASKVLKREDYLEAAEKAAVFLKENLFSDEGRRLGHSYRNGPSNVAGFLDDHAFLISGLLDLYECGGSLTWLRWAFDLQDAQDELFLDREDSGYFNTTGKDPSILLRVKEHHDGAEPSGNSVSALNLIKLSHVISGAGSVAHRNNVEHLLAVFRKRLTDSALSLPLMCCADGMFRRDAWRKQVILIGQRRVPQFNDMMAASWSSYDPVRTVIHVDPSDPNEIDFWEHWNPNIALTAKNNYRPDLVIGVVCQRFTCGPPLTDPHQLASSLLSQPPS